MTESCRVTSVAGSDSSVTVSASMAALPVNTLVVDKAPETALQQAVVIVATFGRTFSRVRTAPAKDLVAQYTLYLVAGARLGMEIVAAPFTDTATNRCTSTSSTKDGVALLLEDVRKTPQ